MISKTELVDVEIHLVGQILVPPHPLARRYPHAVVSADLDGAFVGQIEAVLFSGFVAWSKACELDVEALEQRVGRPLRNWWTVIEAQIEKEFFGLGLGVHLYASLVELVGTHWPDAVLVAHGCEPEMGETSPMAHRVWRSRRFADAVWVDGLAATTREGPSHPRLPARIYRIVRARRDPVETLKASLL